MTAETYLPGEWVDIHIASAQVESTSADSIVVKIGALRAGNKGTTRRDIPTDEYAGVLVTRVLPADGYPEVGDVWRDRNGDEYYARQVGDRVAFIDANEVRSGRLCHDITDVNRQLGPLTLAYRKPAGGES